MKNLLESLFFIVLVSAPLVAQDRVMVSAHGGWYFHNAENSFQTIGSGRFRAAYGFGLVFEKDSVGDLTLHAGYSYGKATAPGVLRFRGTDVNGNPTGSAGSVDLSFGAHEFDVALCLKPLDFVAVSIGPTVVVTERTIEASVPVVAGMLSGATLNDRLVTWCVGGRGAVSFRTLAERRQPFVFATLSLTYFHSVWFDPRGRDLSNYYQSALLSRCELGVGYSL